MEKFMKVASQGFTKPAKVSSQGTFKSASHTFLELTQISVCTLDACSGSAVQLGGDSGMHYLADPSSRPRRRQWRVRSCARNARGGPSRAYA